MVNEKLEKFVEEQHVKPAVKFSAGSEAYLRALQSFNVDQLKTFLKTWDRKNYKSFSKAPYVVQKRAMCEAIIELNEVLKDQELFDKAKKYLDEHPAETKLEGK